MIKIDLINHCVDLFNNTIYLTSDLLANESFIIKTSKNCQNKRIH